jgi:hypothetical protein
MTSLRDLFPNLFTKSVLPNGVVAQMGIWEGDVWRWELAWHSVLTTNELEEAQYLQTLLQQVSLTKDTMDRCRWLAHTAGLFSVKTAYKALLNGQTSPVVDANSTVIFKQLWWNNVPSKVSIFGWRLLLGKLLTREALYNKGIITNNLERCCVFCFKEVEDIHYVLFNCNASRQVWNKVFRWMGVRFIPFEDIHNHFSLFSEFLQGTKNNKFRHIIWLTTT